MTLREKAFRSVLHSRFVAREDDLGRPLTDQEVKDEAAYLLETIPYGGIYEGRELATAKRQLKAIISK